MSPFLSDCVGITFFNPPLRKGQKRKHPVGTVYLDRYQSADEMAKTIRHELCHVAVGPKPLDDEELFVEAITLNLHLIEAKFERGRIA